MDSLMIVHGLTESDADAATVDVGCMMHFRQARAKRLMISLDPLQCTGNYSWQPFNGSDDISSVFNDKYLFNCHTHLSVNK